MNVFQKIFGLIFTILILPFAIIVIPVLNALGLNSAKLKPDDVLSYLYRMCDGEIDDYWWDDFWSLHRAIVSVFCQLLGCDPGISRVSLITARLGTK